MKVKNKRFYLLFIAISNKIITFAAVKQTNLFIN